MQRREIFFGPGSTIEEDAIEESKLGGLHCSGARIAGDVILSKFETDSCVVFIHAEIGGTLRCGGVKFLRPKTRGEQTEPVPRKVLICTGAKIGIDVKLTEFAAEGAVWFNSAEIGGELLCHKGSFSNGPGLALYCDQVRTARNINLNELIGGPTFRS